ncbi:hypothetical protein MKW98_024356, partial [Papaver atlanticum]
MTITDLFLNARHMELVYSGSLPCIKIYTLVSWKRYTKALPVHQRFSLVKQSRLKSREWMKALSEAMKTNNYGAEPTLRGSGDTFSSEFTQVEARVLQPP